MADSRYWLFGSLSLLTFGTYTVLIVIHLSAARVTDIEDNFNK